MLVAARTGAWAKIGGVVPTAKDYVQDGLVHLADGIENVGYGVHDPYATTLKDCVTGFNVCSSIESVDGGTWLKTNFRVDESKFYYYSEDATITTVFTPNDYGWWLWDAGALLALDGYTGHKVEVGPHISGRYPMATLMTGYSGSSLARVSGTFVKKGINCCTLVWHGGSKVFDVFDGDILKGSADCSAVWPEGMTKWAWNAFASPYFGEQYKFVLHNARCYNRALTAAEIAANYAIDKARFGIGGNA